MSEVEPEGVVGGVRGEIGRALDGRFTPEQVRLLLDEILAIKKQVWVSCGHCKKRSLVEVADAKAVAGALKDLASEAWGRPVEGNVESGITFVREVRFDERYSGPD